jgi:predicted AAA+ superfamily ATPase
MWAVDTVAVLGQSYRPRVLDGPLEHALAIAGAVVIEGARATGKTMTALHAASSYVFLDDPETQQVLDVAPRTVLEGGAPRLLDEWQLSPELWNLVRRAVDASPERGRFILTGSAVPADDVTRHTGAGRFLRLRQRTMSWWEKLAPEDTPVSLSALFDGTHPAPNLDAAPDLDVVIDGVLRPGFPALVDLDPADSATRLRAYLDEIGRGDIHRLADIRHGPDVIRRLIAAIARSAASDVAFTTLTADVRAVAPSINAETVSAYVGLLERMFIVEAQQPWAPSLRSRARLRTAAKLHLVDPAVTAAALGAGAQQLRSDLTTLGLLFESAVVHDLAVLATPLGGEVRHYRDSNGKEIDAVIALPDGRWAAVEVKLGGRQMAAGAASLRDAVAQIDTDAVGDPVFRLVVTGTGPIITLDDGTITCPLRALAP